MLNKVFFPSAFEPTTTDFVIDRSVGLGRKEEQEKEIKEITMKN